MTVDRATGGFALAVAAIVLALPALAQGEAVGPCSPYRAVDGDIASEMPGCARRARPAPGSLADEMQFRRARPGAGDDEDAASDADPPRRKPARRRPAP